jgi:hypothetical protein
MPETTTLQRPAAQGPDPKDEIARLNKIIQALMDRAERSANAQGSDFNLFQTTIMLEEQVLSRTAELEAALRENEEVNRVLRKTQADLVAAARSAGMAEIATNVLHNVGNVLNSVNVSAGLILSRVRASKVDGLARCSRATWCNWRRSWQRSSAPSSTSWWRWARASTTSRKSLPRSRPMPAPPASSRRYASTRWSKMHCA